MNSSELWVRLDEHLAPRDTRIVDGRHWPVSHAAGVAARYLRAKGDRAALDARVWDHVAFCQRMTTWRGDRA